MAKTPLSEMERVGRKVSGLLSDIATKMDSLKNSEPINPFEVPEFEDVDRVLDEQMKKINGVKRVWKDYGDNLEKIHKREEQMQKIIDRHTKSTEELTRAKEELNKKLEEEQKADAKTKEALREEIKAYRGEIAKLELAEKSLRKESEKAAKFSQKNLGNNKRFEAFTSALSMKAISLLRKAASAVWKLGIAIVSEGFEALGDSLRSIYEMMGRFRSAMAGLAESISPFTNNVDQLQEAAMQSYLASTDAEKGLGDLGMSIEQITQNYGELQSAMQFTDTLMANEFQRATKLAKAFGLTAGELGKVLRTNKLTGISFQQQDKDMRWAAKTAQKFNMDVKQLSRDIFVTGKNLLDLAGPAFRGQMIKSIAAVTQMGIAVETLERFTDMTDSFEKSAEAMAKLNTAFGMHINALKLFAEEDPAKRLQMIADGIRNSGLSADSARRKIAVFAETLGMSAGEARAFIKYAKDGKDITAIYKQQEVVAENLDNAMMSLRTTLGNVVGMMDKIYTSIAKALTPFFKKLGLTVENTKGEIGGFAELVGKVGTEIAKFFDKVGKDPRFVKAMENLADNVQRFFSWLGEKETQDRFISFISDVVQSMDKWGAVILFTVKAASSLLGIVGFIAKHFEKIWVVLEGLALWIAWKFLPMLAKNLLHAFGRVLVFGIKDVIVFALKWAFRGIMSFISTTLGALVTTFLTAFSITDVIRSALGMVSSETFGGMKKMLSLFFTFAWDGIKDLLDDMGKMFSDAFESVGDWIMSIPDKINSALNWVADGFIKLFKLIRSALEPVWNFIEGIWNKLANSAIGKFVVKIVGKMFGVESPQNQQTLGGSSSVGMIGGLPLAPGGAAQTVATAVGNSYRPAIASSPALPTQSTVQQPFLPQAAAAYQSQVPNFSLYADPRRSVTAGAAYSSTQNNYSTVQNTSNQNVGGGGAYKIELNIDGQRLHDVMLKAPLRSVY